MVWQLPVGWFVAIDVLAWAAIHMAAAWAMTRLDAGRFDPDSWLYRERGFEGRQGELYERLFAVHRWKKKLPDGAALFRGSFRKKRLVSRDPAYLASFARETCRGELTHWLALAATPLFALWNPPSAMAGIVGYALLANAPCIVAQRYNRIRLTRMLELLARRAGRDDGGGATERRVSSGS